MMARKNCKQGPYLIKDVCLRCPHELTPYPNQTFCIVMLMLDSSYDFTKEKFAIPEDCLFRLEHVVAQEPE